MGELMDWWAYYLYLNDHDDDEASNDQAKMDTVKRMKQKCGA